MRCLFGFMCVLALGVMPLVGCSETTGDGGNGGSAGSGGTAGDGGTGGMPECQNPEDCDDGEECTTDTCASGVCENMTVEDGTVCDESNECAVGQCASGACGLTPVTNGTVCGDDAGTCQDGSCEVACTEQGILDAVAAGGGPYTFDCVAPTTVVTTDTILIDDEVVLDGEGNLTLDGDDDHPVLALGTPDLGTVELRGFRVTGGPAFGIMNVGYAIYVCCDTATVTLKDSTVSDNGGDGIQNQESTLMLLNTTVSGNGFANVSNLNGTLTVTNSTISGGEVGINNAGQMTISNSTVVSENLAVRTPSPATFANTIVAGGCESDAVTHVSSNGYNIESPGNTCGFNQVGDQVVSAVELDLQPLASNGGPTQTHAITTDSAAFNAGTCEVDEDQRGVTRPQGPACDVGAFELEVGP